MLTNRFPKEKKTGKNQLEYAKNKRQKQSKPKIVLFSVAEHDKKNH